MSWAEVVKGDVSSPSDQPQPDPVFLDAPSGPTGVPASDHKVTVVPNEHPKVKHHPSLIL
jgi:hypothetical protein